VPTVTPAHRLVGALAIVNPSPAGVTAALEFSRHAEFDWPYACDLAARNSVLPALARNVARSEEFAPPPEIRTQFELARVVARACTAARSTELAPVFDKWTRHGVCWSLMKGAALIAAAYPPDSRMLNDVDVLVAAGDYPRARRILVAAGFVPMTGAHSEETMLALKEQVVFAGPARVGAAATRVDLHRQVYGPSKPYRFDASEFLQRRSSVTFGGTPAFALDETDLLLHLATQLLNDRLLVKLLRLADLQLLLSRTEVDELERRAAATGSLPALAVARAAVSQVLVEAHQSHPPRSDVDRRSSAIVRALLARGWPWADAFESGRLPEEYRTAAAWVAERGLSPAILSWLRTAGDYRKARRASGASALRSMLGATRMSVAGLATFGRLRWELRGHKPSESISRTAR